MLVQYNFEKNRKSQGRPLPVRNGTSAVLTRTAPTFIVGKTGVSLASSGPVTKRHILGLQRQIPSPSPGGRSPRSRCGPAGSSRGLSWADTVLTWSSLCACLCPHRLFMLDQGPA